MTHPNNSDTQVDELDEILYSLANFYTTRGQEGYRLDGSDYEGAEEAKAALLSWRDKHTAKMVREARIDEVKRIDREQDDTGEPFLSDLQAHYIGYRIAQLTINSKEDVK